MTASFCKSSPGKIVFKMITMVNTILIPMNIRLRMEKMTGLALTDSIDFFTKLILFFNKSLASWDLELNFAMSELQMSPLLNPDPPLSRVNSSGTPVEQYQKQLDKFQLFKL
jgi:hypothetical protein